MSKLKYNYVLIEESMEYLQYFFRGFIENPGCQFIQMKNQSFVIDVRDLQISKTNNNTPYCFIIGGRVYEFYGNYLIANLRKNYPGCKVVIELIDLVKNYQFEVENIRDWFDLGFVFEIGDARKHDLVYIPITFEYLPIPNRTVEYDFFFAGGRNKEKGRMEEVISLYQDLTLRGYNCDFWLADVPSDEQDNSIGIHYGYLPFKDVLKHTVSAKCIVDLVQKEMLSPTVRYIESILYGKHLLTNVSLDCYEKPYDRYRKHVHIYERDMDLSFLNEKVEYDLYVARKIFSNDSFIQKIENHILND